jgi:hypothetical protein
MQTTTRQGQTLSVHLEAIPAGEGLCLTGGTFERQELAPDAVAACQQQCEAWMREVLS